MNYGCIEKTIRVFGLTEEEISTLLNSLNLPEGIAFSYWVEHPEIVVEIRFPYFWRTIHWQLIDEALNAIEKALGSHGYGTAWTSLPMALGDELSRRGCSVGVAESCTGGMVGQLLTQAPGASRYFPGGFIVYSGAMKTRLLGVSEQVLATYGEVSSQCARAMALGVLERTGADWGLAVTGWAGPGSGNGPGAVGTVYMAVAGPPGVGGDSAGEPWVRVVGRQLTGNREQIRRTASLNLMWILYDRLKGMAE